MTNILLSLFIAIGLCGTTNNPMEHVSSEIPLASQCATTATSIFVGITETAHDVSMSSMINTLERTDSRTVLRPHVVYTPTITIQPYSSSSISTTDDVYVYVTKTGKKYHKDGCRYLKSSKIKIKLSEAIKSYNPCKICKPPTSLKGRM